MKKQAKTPKLTKWFAADVRPTRRGSYDYKYGHGYVFTASWSGKQWVITDKNFPDDCGHFVITRAGDQWRGLAANPKVSA